MPPRKKQAAPSAPARRSSRVAANEAAAEAKMHAEALAATKDWFSEMGKEMQIAEDREAAELFAQTVMDHEKKTGLVCVMLDSVEDESDESDDEDDDDDDEDADEADDSDAEPSEVSGSGSDDDDGSDEDEEEDPLWAPDGMKERLENALKVYVPPNAAETLDSLQLTLRLTEAVPGGGAVLAEKVVDAAVNAIEANDKNADADAAFDNAFAATVAMAEADAERTWAHDKKRAAKMIAKLGITWRWLFRIYEKHERANRGEAPRGLRRLEATGVAALETYLDQRCAEKWRAMGLTTNKFYAVAAVAGSGKGKKRARAE